MTIAKPAPTVTPATSLILPTTPRKVHEMKCESCDRPILLDRQERKQTFIILIIVTAIMLAGAGAEWLATVDLF